uniref:Large ribosomal subunit protein uL22c n=1 Tax=Dipterosiphonia australica TaxID=2007208 RepID=A0A1Z1MLB7_9FLOR|nr:ribosomal protein L22 [Dipterosiphonia australica]ARW66873.1 ribosomal protein L22 [Dipterosiphonia australica]
MNKSKIQSKAITKYTRTSQYKSGRVLKQIQGKTYHEARLILEFMPYRACKVISKTLESAFSNIKQKVKINISKHKIYIKEAYANKGPVLKRFQPRAQGRAFPIRKPTCHITITLEL